MPLAFDAVVLAAGRSTRMGRDKALLTAADGRPMWERQRDVLRTAGADEIFLSARPEQGWSRSAGGFAGTLHDAMPGCGPIVGITAALERSAKSHVAVLAIDLPGVGVGWFQELAGRSAAGSGCVGRRDGFFEPLAAIYPRELMYLAWEALARHEYALQKLIATAVDRELMTVREIAADEAQTFANWNEPGAMAPTASEQTAAETGRKCDRES